MPGSDILKIPYALWTDTFSSLQSFLPSEGVGGLLMMLGICVAACWYFSYWQFHGSLPIGKKPEAHEDNPELLNFRPASSYHRPSGEVRLPNAVDFRNELQLGEVLIIQQQMVYQEDLVHFVFKDTNPEHHAKVNLHFKLPGCPRVPADLREVAESFFEDTSADYHFLEPEFNELKLTQKNSDHYSLECFEKQSSEPGFSLTRCVEHAEVSL